MTGWVLAVEDNQDDRELLRHAWLRAAIASRLETVDGGRQALARLELLHEPLPSPARPGRGPAERASGQDPGAEGACGLPCAILLDLKMPQVDGLQVLTQVRARPWLYNVPVVILSSSAEPSDLVRSYALGANGFVVKPVDFDDFIVAIAVTGRYWTAINEPPPQESHARTVAGALGRGPAG
jgi:CheY-like chemotaxis protein